MTQQEKKAMLAAYWGNAVFVKTGSEEAIYSIDASLIDWVCNSLAPIEFKIVLYKFNQMTTSQLIELEKISEPSSRIDHLRSIGVDCGFKSVHSLIDAGYGIHTAELNCKQKSHP